MIWEAHPYFWKHPYTSNYWCLQVIIPPFLTTNPWHMAHLPRTVSSVFISSPPNLWTRRTCAKVTCNAFGHVRGISEDVWHIPGICEILLLKISGEQWKIKILGNGCFNWMIPNLYIGNCRFTNHPFLNGCLGFQVSVTLQQLSNEKKAPFCWFRGFGWG